MQNTRSPYSAFNFRVDIGGDDFGGFSDVSGLGTEITIAEYRSGQDKKNRVSKVPGMYKVSDVTLKRGLIDSGKLYEWIKTVRTEGIAGQRSVTITLMDESGESRQKWHLMNTVPMKYTGPTLAAKGGTDVAMEELVLSAEDLTFEEV